MKSKTIVLKGQKGSVMLEFALVSTILIILLTAIIEFGLVFNAQLTLDNVARDGARFISLPNNNNESKITNYISLLAPTLNPPISASNISIEPQKRVRNQPFTLTITYNYKLPVNFGILPDTFVLTSKTTMMQQ